MEITTTIQPGMTHENSYRVEEIHSAIHIGSGSLKVLATPMMIAFIERTARDFVQTHLPEGYSSVGVHVDIRHLAPTPLGKTVRAICRVEAVAGAKIDFSVEAWDEQEQVGAGTHRRVVIDVERFLRRVRSKQAESSGA